MRAPASEIRTVPTARTTSTAAATPETAKPVLEVNARVRTETARARRFRVALFAGAPESKGKCGGDGVCLLLSERTHVYDVANRPWLLPFIAEKATGDVRDFLRDLIRRASAEIPEDRPFFAELVDRIDEYETRRRDTTESVPPSPPRETTRLEAHAAVEAPDAKTLLARASMIDHWFQTKKGNRPSTWTVWKPDQVPGP